jgi:hypothetical protein
MHQQLQWEFIKEEDGLMRGSLWLIVSATEDEKRERYFNVELDVKMPRLVLSDQTTEKLVVEVRGGEDALSNLASWAQEVLGKMVVCYGSLYEHLPLGMPMGGVESSKVEGGDEKEQFMWEFADQP